MAYAPTESEAKTLGFKTDSPAQPYPTRGYYLELPNGNYLTFTPVPSMQSAMEMTPKKVKVAKHFIDSLQDLYESAAGRGKRQLLRSLPPTDYSS